MRKLGLKFAGGSHTKITKLVKQFNIDTSHFDIYKLARETLHRKKLKWQEVLKLNSIGRREAAYRLRRALIESGVKYECEICKVPPVWNKKELRLQVDHLNQNWQDNRRENLRFICPNCHSQTEGFCGSKGKTSIIKDKL
jgi:Zn finger protein HypA/HybF involved in hydrogenase expression